jgi:hypothetical protein
MKAILKFDDEQELRDAIDGWKWKNAMWNLDKEMRDVTKHGQHDGRDAIEAEIEITEHWREKIRELLNDNGLDLES